jgi:hypothetical protein
MIMVFYGINRFLLPPNVVELQRKIRAQEELIYDLQHDQQVITLLKGTLNVCINLISITF